MPYRIDVAYMRVRELKDVVEVVVTDHGMPQQIAWFNFVNNPHEPIECGVEYEVIFQRKVKTKTEKERARHERLDSRSHHPDHRVAGRIQRRRRRAVLRHRILRRRRAGPDHRDLADPAVARKDLKHLVQDGGVFMATSCVIIDPQRKKATPYRERPFRYATCSNARSNSSQSESSGATWS